MSVFDVVAFHRLEVGVKTAFVVAHGEVAVPWIHVFVDAGTGGKFPFGFGGKSERLYVYALLAERAAQEVGAPVCEGICLLPAYSYHGILVVAAVREVHTHVWLVVCVLKIVYPGSCVGVYIYYISVEEVVGTGERTCYCGALNYAVFVDERGVFRNHGVVGRRGFVGVVLAAQTVETVATARSFCLVVYFVAVIELFGIEFAHTGYRISAIHTFNGSLLVLVWVSPRNRLVPVEVWSHGVAFAVFFDFEFLVAAVCRVCQTLPDN